MTKILRVCFPESNKSSGFIRQIPIYKNSHPSNKLFFARIRIVVRKRKLIQSPDNKVIDIIKIKKR